MTADRVLKKALEKHEICSEVHAGGQERTNGSSKAENSGQSAGKFKPPVVSSEVEVSTEWTEDLRQPEQ